MFKTIEAKELLNAAEAKDFFLIDVRSEEDPQVEFIAGAVQIPFTQINDRVKEIPRNKRVVILCNNGSKAGMVRNFLMGQFKMNNVYALEGGINLFFHFMKTAKAG